jgi:hypothetical protein
MERKKRVEIVHGKEIIRLNVKIVYQAENINNFDEKGIMDDGILIKVIDKYSKDLNAQPPFNDMAFTLETYSRVIFEEIEASKPHNVIIVGVEASYNLEHFDCEMDELWDNTRALYINPIILKSMGGNSAYLALYPGILTFMQS